MGSLTLSHGTGQMESCQTFFGISTDPRRGKSEGRQLEISVVVLRFWGLQQLKFEKKIDMALFKKTNAK